MLVTNIKIQSNGTFFFFKSVQNLIKHISVPSKDDTLNYVVTTSSGSRNKSFLASYRVFACMHLLHIYFMLAAK